MAEAAAALIADDTNGGNDGIAILGSIFLWLGAGNKLIPSFICC
jgi:hypothetical protein